jgi:hypothetical protein
MKHLPNNCCLLLLLLLLLLHFVCRGWTANTIKVVPQNAIRLVSYEAPA